MPISVADLAGKACASTCDEAVLLFLLSSFLRKEVYERSQTIDKRVDSANRLTIFNT